MSVELIFVELNAFQLYVQSKNLRLNLIVGKTGNNIVYSPNEVRKFV